MIRAEVGLADRDGPFHVRHRTRVRMEAAIGFAEHRSDFCFYEWLILESITDPGRGPVQCFLYGQVRVPVELVTVLREAADLSEQVPLEKVLHRAGDGSLGSRHILS